MKKFTIGAISGMTSLAIAVPLLAQVAGAASDDSTSSAANGNRPAPSQACVNALASRDASELTQMDAIFAARKAALQKHREALLKAAELKDELQRVAAVKAANEAMHTSMQAAMGTPEDHKAEMEALRTACGDTFGKHGGMKFMKMGMGGPGGHHGGKMFRKEFKGGDPAAQQDVMWNVPVDGSSSSVTQTQ